MPLLRRLAPVALLFASLPMLSAHMYGQTAAKANTSTSSSAKPTPAATAATADKIDINSATADQLKSLDGIGDAYAKRIIDGRPYANKTQLTTRGVLPAATYAKVKDKIVATQAKAAGKPATK